MADGRHLEKSKNINIFATDWPILTKFGMQMCLKLWILITNKISWFQKSKMAAAAILKIRKIAISPQRNDQFWRNLVQLCVWALRTPTTNKILRIRQLKMDAAAILKNQIILISSQPIDQFRRNLARCCVLTRSTQKPTKFHDFKNPRWQWRLFWKFEKLQYLYNLSLIHISEPTRPY